MLGEQGDQHESHSQALGQRDLRNLDSVSINTLPLRRWGDRRPQAGKGCHTARLPAELKPESRTQKAKAELALLSVTGCDFLSPFTSTPLFHR